VLREYLVRIAVGMSLSIMATVGGAGCGRLQQAAQAPQSQPTESDGADPAPAGADQRADASGTGPARAGQGRKEQANDGKPAAPRTTRCESDTHRTTVQTLNAAWWALSYALPAANEAPSGGAMGQGTSRAEIETLLRDARDCFSRSLHLAPNSYLASLGMGLAYLIGAKVEILYEDPAKSRSRAYLASAKHYLGQAYVLRQGIYEPVYYLALVAILEDDFARATLFLDGLAKTSFRPGSLHALRAYVNERQNQLAAAKTEYQTALDLGASQAELEWAFARLEALKGK